MRHLNKTKFYSSYDIKTIVPTERVRKVVIDSRGDMTDIEYDGFWLDQTKLHCDVCRKRDPLAEQDIGSIYKQRVLVYMLADEMYIYDDYWFYIPEYHFDCVTDLQVKLTCPL